MTTNTNKEVIGNNEVAAPAVVIAAAPSKAKIANGIFSEMFAMSPQPARKDMIQRAVKEAGLTESGAATYLQNYKSKNGLTAPRAAAPATA